MGVAQLWLGQMTELNPRRGLSRRTSGTVQPRDSGDGLLEPAKLSEAAEQGGSQERARCPPDPPASAVFGGDPRVGEQEPLVRVLAPVCVDGLAGPKGS